MSSSAPIDTKWHELLNKNDAKQKSENFHMFLADVMGWVRHIRDISHVSLCPFASFVRLVFVGFKEGWNPKDELSMVASVGGWDEVVSTRRNARHVQLGMHRALLLPTQANCIPSVFCAPDEPSRSFQSRRNSHLGYFPPCCHADI